MKNRIRIIAAVLLFSLLFTIAAAAGSQYTVASGDTLSSIAQKFGVSISAIQSANGMKSDFLKIGQVLTIPGGSSSSSSASTPPTSTAVGEPEDPSAPEDPATAFSNISVDFLNVVSFEYKDADIRSILATIGEYTGYKILYLGEPQRISVSASVVSPVKAISLIAGAGENLTSVVDGDVIIVGPKARLLSSFIYSKLSVRLNLINIEAKDFAAMLESLGINTDEITISDKSPNILIIKATPKELAYALLAKNLADKANFSSENAAGEKVINRKELTFVNITAEDFGKLMDKMQLNARLILRESGSKTAVCVGTADAMADIDKLVGYFDVAENVPSAPDSSRVGVTVYTPLNYQADYLYSILDPVREIADPLLLTGNNKQLLIIGTQKSRNEAILLLESADVADTQKKAAILARSKSSDALSGKRDKISSQTGIPKDRMSIFKPDGSDSNGESILYIVDTAGNLTKAMNVK